MLAAGESEYPVSSAIGLAIHGFVPAALGSARPMDALRCAIESLTNARSEQGGQPNRQAWYILKA